MARVARVTPTAGTRGSRGSASPVSSGRQAAGGECCFSWLPSPRRDLAAGAARRRFRGGRERATRTRARPRIRKVPGPRQGSPRTPGSPGPGWHPAACPWPGRTIPQRRCRCLAISAARSSSPPSPRGTGRRTASATTRPVSSSAIAAAASRAAAAPGEESQPTRTRRNRLALIAATPSDGGSRQPCQPPLLPQPDRDRGHQRDSQPAVPGPGTDPGPALWRASSPVVIVNLAAAAHKTRTFA